MASPDGGPRIKTDLHIHTVASGHAYSTVREICAAAAARGLEMVAITDHGPALPGAPHTFHFVNMIVLPRELSGVKILRSAECNITGPDGDLDIDPGGLAALDIVHAGLHPLCGYAGHTLEENTEAVLNAIRGGYVDVLVHPGNPYYPLDYGTVVAEATSKGMALEVNNSSFISVRRGSEQNCAIIIEEAKRLGTRMCVASDAHDASQVGVFDDALELIDSVGLPEEQIINRDTESVLQFLRERGKEIAFPGAKYR